MQVFTFCEENYAKSTGAHTALSEIEQHEWDALTTSEGFNLATWVSVEKHRQRINFSEGKYFVTTQKKTNLFGCYPSVIANDQQCSNPARMCIVSFPLLVL